MADVPAAPASVSRRRPGAGARASVEAASLALARVALLAGPAALAFFEGGYFDSPRNVAASAAWALVGLVALTSRGPVLPSAAWGRIALAALVLLTGWVALSATWAPLPGPADDDLRRLLLYLAALILAAAAWRARPAARWIEPCLALGALVVVSYGLAERLLPGLIRLDVTSGAGGRLEQPLTYWNAMGALAAMGTVLAARVAGDRTRAARLRAAAALAFGPLGLGLYLTFSRGAVGTLAAGLLVLLLLDPTRAQARAVALAALSGLLTAGTARLLPALEAVGPASAERRWQGAAMLGILALLGIAAALAQRRAIALEARAPGAGGRLRLPRRRPALIAAAAVALLAGPLAAVAIDRARVEGSPVASAPDPTRLTDAGSNRYDYWAVALRATADEPLRGVGAGGFRVEWLRERTISEAVQDAHSLYLETGAELGFVGLALLALVVAGVALTARAVQARDPALACGWCAALTVWALHAGIDWDWEMPALTLIAIVLAGALIARAGAPVSPVRRGVGGRAGD